MKTKVFVVFVLAFAGYCANSRATITNAFWNNDGDGAINCQQVGSFNGTTLSMAGDQCWGPGHMLGTVQTDSPQDPTLYLGSSVNNDTSFAWTSYQVNVVMPVDFSFVANAIFPNVENYPPSGPSDWTVASVIAPTLQATGIYAGDYEGTINLTGGTPIPIGTQQADELDFGYGITFAGSTDYSFTQEMIPMGVPEPGDLGLASGLLFGGFQLVKLLRKKA
jgi:hypothetical protein